MITLAHASDTHNLPSTVREIATSTAEVLLLTGDIMANSHRLFTPGWTTRHEERWQSNWFRKQAKKWAQDIGQRPVVLVHGNHDYHDATSWLRHYGVDVHDVGDGSVDLLGLRFAGFRQIPHMGGRWAGEEHDLRPFVTQAFAANPDVLVTHAPASGILSDRWGSSDLRTALDYQEHKIRYHFFGHIHECGGENIMHNGVYHANGACCFREHTITT